VTDTSYPRIAIDRNERSTTRMVRLHRPEFVNAKNDAKSTNTILPKDCWALRVDPHSQRYKKEYREQEN